MWLVLETEEYLARSGDRELVDRLKPRLLDIAGYFADYLNGDGLLENLPPVVFVDATRANKLTQGVSYPSNMLWTRALDALARLYDLPAFAVRAAAMRKEILRQSWNGRWFRDHAVRDLEGRLAPSEECTEACQYYAYFCGVATSASHPDHWRTLVEDFGPQRETTGLHAEVHPTDCFIGRQLRLEVMSQAGLGDRILSDIKGYFGDMAEKTGTLWEYKSGRHSLSHGFQGHVAYLLHRATTVTKGMAREAADAPSWRQSHRHQIR
jgi:alpha-L-rhamnosidase